MSFVSHSARTATLNDNNNNNTEDDNDDNTITSSATTTMVVLRLETSESECSNNSGSNSRKRERSPLLPRRGVADDEEFLRNQGRARVRPQRRQRWSITCLRRCLSSSRISTT